MVVTTTVTKFTGSGVRTTIPSKIAKQMGVVAGDTLLWSCDPATRTFTVKVLND